MNGNKVGIGQLEVVDLSILDKVKDGLKAEIAKVKGEGRHSVFLLLTGLGTGGMWLYMKKRAVKSWCVPFSRGSWWSRSCMTNWSSCWEQRTAI